MSAVACPSCRKTLRFKIELAGKKIRCPQCRTAVTLPSGDDDTPSQPKAAEIDRSSDPLRAEASYKLEGEIARGGMGAIVRAVDREIRREVAVKFLLNQSDARQKSRFVEEAQITGQLEHPNIVPIHQLGVAEDGRCFFSMKMVKGRTFAEVLKETGKAEAGLGRLLTIFTGICNGMAYAHSRNVIHRDLKPANVMIGDFGEVYVMDWGLAKVVGGADREANTAFSSAPVNPFSNLAAAEPGVTSSAEHASVATSARQDAGDLTQDGAVLGTPAYMPPEQARGEEVDERADIYSLGAILYEILTRTPPVGRGGDMMQILMRVAEGRIDAPAVRAPERFKSGLIPAELSAIAMKALSKNREDRYPTVESLLRDIQRYLEGRSVSAKQDSAWEMFTKLVRRNKGLSAGLATTAVVMFASLIFLLSAWRETKHAYVKFEAEQVEKAKTIQHALPALGRFARQLAGEGRIDEANRQIELTLAYDPANAEATLLQAELLVADEKWTAARTSLDAYLKVHASPAAARLSELAARCEGEGDTVSPATLSAIAQTLQDEKLFVPATRILQRVQKNAKSRDPLRIMYTKQVASQWPGKMVSLDAFGRLIFRDFKSAESYKDLSPLKGIPLELVEIIGWKKLSNLDALRDMPLESVRFESCSALTDISPLRNAKLDRVNLGFCPIAELGPLRGMKLNSARLSNLPIFDLAPLRGMPMKTLDLSGSVRIADLSPLAEMPLTELDLSGCTAVSELGPLKGMPLTRLDLHALTRITSLEPLRGMPLEWLDIAACAKIVDFEPLRGMPLKHLNLSSTKAKTLEPLRESPLTQLSLDSYPDISGVEGMKLEAVFLNLNINRKGLDVLRSMESLKSIQLKVGGRFTPEEFFQKLDAGELSGK